MSKGMREMPWMWTAMILLEEETHCQMYLHHRIMPYIRQVSRARNEFLLLQALHRNPADLESSASPSKLRQSPYPPLRSPRFRRSLMRRRHREMLREMRHEMRREMRREIQHDMGREMHLVGIHMTVIAMGDANGSVNGRMNESGTLFAARPPSQRLLDIGVTRHPKGRG